MVPPQPASWSLSSMCLALGQQVEQTRGGLPSQEQPSANEGGMLEEKYSSFLASQGESSENSNFLTFLPALLIPHSLTVLSGTISQIYYLHPNPCLGGGEGGEAQN